MIAHHLIDCFVVLHRPVPAEALRGVYVEGNNQVLDAGAVTQCITSLARAAETMEIGRIPDVLATLDEECRNSLGEIRTLKANGFGELPDLERGLALADRFVAVVLDHRDLLPS